MKCVFRAMTRCESPALSAFHYSFVPQTSAPGSPPLDPAVYSAETPAG